MQRGFINAVVECHKAGIATGRSAEVLLQEKAEQVRQVPLYIRQGHKMLSKALLEHDKRSGVVEGCRPDANLQAMPLSEKPAGAAGAKRKRRNQ
jgi:hypothetical protein